MSLPEEHLLEYIKGEIFANIFQTDKIVKIDPETGRVKGWIDLEGLLKKQSVKEPVDVLNGIAYDKKNNRLFVTGKLWPSLFEIELIPVSPNPETHSPPLLSDKITIE